MSSPEREWLGAEKLETLVERLRDAGRTRLSELEGLEVAALIGLATPATLAAPDLAAVEGLSLETLPGERVVLKVSSPEVVHKSERGGVVTVAKRPRALVDAARRMAARFTPLEVGFLCQELVAHDTGLGDELLLSYRFTEELGPLVSIGPGGLWTEHLDAALLPERRTVIVSPDFADRTTLASALSASLLGPILGGTLRGQAPRLPEEELLALLERMLRLARNGPRAGLLELELNPVALARGRPVALDATGLVGSPPAWDAAALPAGRDLAPLLRPRSIAVLGVSKQQNPGRQIVLNCLAEGFDSRRLWIVKPGATGDPVVEGCPSVPSLAALPEPVDLLVLALDAERSAAAVEEAIREQRARSIVLIAGGFGEGAGGEDDARRVLGALEAARIAGAEPPVVVGGNCLGVRSRPGRSDTLFVPRHKNPVAEGPAARLALVSQSGALILSRTSQLEGLVPRIVVTLGNQLDLTLGETLEHLRGDPEVRTAACYVEGFRPGDGLRFMRAARDFVGEGRAVILYRAGRTATGAAAAASHTASLAGDEPATRALARASGVLVADSLAELDDLVRVAVAFDDRRIPGLRLGVLSNAGFESVAVADNLGPLTLAPLTAESRARLAAVFSQAGVGTIARVANPLDVTPMMGDRAFVEAASILLADTTVDLALVGCVPFTASLTTLLDERPNGEGLDSPGTLVPELARLAAGARAWVAVVDAGGLYDPMARRLAGAGVPVFRHADRAVRVLGRYAAWRRRWGRDPTNEAAKRPT